MQWSDHQVVHRRLMQAICETIHSEDKPLVLKGGTALLLGYNLQRFSEDLDFDLTVALKGHINLESLCRTAVRKISREGLNLALSSFKVLKIRKPPIAVAPCFRPGRHCRRCR